MRARGAGGLAGGTRVSRPLLVLVAWAAVTMAPAACGGAAPEVGSLSASPAPTIGSTTPATATLPGPEPTSVPAAVPTQVPTPGSTGGRPSAPIAWDVLEAPGEVSDVVSTRARLVAVGTLGTNPESGDTAGAWTSPDGRTWEPAKVAQPAGTMTAVAGRPGRLVAVGTVFEGTSGPAAWTSVDGATWQALPASAFPGSAGYQPGALEDIAAGPGGFVAVGSEVGAGGSRAAAWFSGDGLSWTHSQSNLGGDSAGVVLARGSGYVAAGWAPGENGDAWALFWSSPDGRTWTAAPDSKDLHGIGSTPRLAAAQQHLVAVGYPTHQWAVTEPIVWTSQDGVAWQRPTASGLVAPLPSHPSIESGPPLVTSLAVRGLTGTDDGFVASATAYTLGAGAGPRVVRRVVWTSPTGTSWSIAADLPDGPADPGSEPALAGPLVVHQGRLLVFGRPMGAGSAPLWETNLRALFDQGR